MWGLPDSAIVYGAVKATRGTKKASKSASSGEIFTPEFKKAVNEWFKNLEAQLKEKK